MTKKITRWYKGNKVTKISYEEAGNIYNSSPFPAEVFDPGRLITNDKNESVFFTFLGLAPLDSDNAAEKEGDPNNPDINANRADIYHITVQFPAQNIYPGLTGENKFDPKAFGAATSPASESASDLVTAIKTEALRLYSESRSSDNTEKYLFFLGGFAGEESQTISNDLIKRMICTRRFYHDPGNNAVGASMYFQVLLFVDLDLQEKIEAADIENAVNNFGVEETINSLDNPAVDKDKERASTGLGEGSQGPPRKLFNKIYNDGSLAYKTGAQVAQELQRFGLVDEKIINDSVRRTLLHVGDPVLLNILRNATEIRSIDDFYDKVLNAIPVPFLIQETVTCLLKLLKTDPISQACNTVLRNISNKDVQNIITWAYRDLEGELFRALIKQQTSLTDGDLDKPTASSTTIAIAREFILETYRQGNPSQKDIICIAVLAAIPAAAALLSTLSGDDAKKLGQELVEGVENFTEDAIESISEAFTKANEELLNRLDNLTNPIVDAMEAIADTLEAFQVMRMGSNWSEKLTGAIIGIVTQLVVEAIGALLRELAGICDGDASADFANLKTPDANEAALDDLENLQFPFEQDNFQDVIANPEVFDEIENYLDNKVSRELLDDFFDSLNDLLTVSEICALLSTYSTGLNYNSIINKIYYGLLSLDKFKPLKDVLKDELGVKELFLLFSGSVDSKLCKEKIDALSDTKKLLNALCAPNSDDLLTEDLKRKLTDDALNSINKSEDQILQDIMDSIYQLQNPNLLNLPLFCGPEADLLGKKPIFDSLEHDTSKYIDEKFLNDVFSAIQEIFENELQGFKPVFTNQFGSGANAAGKFFTGPASPANMTNAMNGLYGFGNNIDTNNIQGLENKNANDLNNLVGEFGIVAKKVYDSIVAASKNGIITEATDAPPNIKIKLSDILSDQPEGSPIRYSLNYSGVEYENVPANTAALVIGGTAFLSSLESHSYLDFFNNIDALNNTQQQSEYTNRVLSTVESLTFFGALIEQIIKEHAEYVSSGTDLFKKQNFDRLQINKNNSCDDSLFKYSDIIERYKENTRKLGCTLGFGQTPTATEKSKMYAIYEGYLRVLTINEFLKSFFVFASYGVDAILPPNSEDKKDFDSFYFTYLVDQINRQMLIFEQSTEMFSEQLLQTSIKQVYMARNNLDFEEPGLTDQQIKNNAIREMISTSIKQIQPIVVSKLVSSGFTTKGTFFEGGELSEEFSNPLQNIYQTCLNNIIASYGNYNPPPVVEVDFSHSLTRIPSGFYSRDSDGRPSRLFNGGFFVENGFEVEHKREGASDAFSKNFYETIFFGLPEKVQIGQELKIFLNKDEILQTGQYTRLNFATDVFGGGNISKYLFGSVPSSAPGPFGNIPSYDTQDTFFDKKASVYMNQEQIKKISEKEGYISYDSTAFTAGYFGSSPTVSEIDEFIQNVTRGLQNSTALPNTAVINSFRSQLQNKNFYFSKLQGYKTLNVLIPVDELPPTEMAAGTIFPMTTLLNSLLPILFGPDNNSSENNQVDELSRKDFINAVLQRKYFIQEGTDGKKYFKLPLVKIITGIPADFASVTMYDEGRGFDNSFANSEVFRSLIDSIQYKNILSFVAVLLTESVQRNYQGMNNIFKKTLFSLNSAKNNIVSVAERQENPDFYKYEPDSLTPASGVDFNMIYLFLEALLKAGANVVDPTWRTPWFLPGPLTPVGIITKILDGVPNRSSEGNLSNGSEDKDNIVSAAENSLDCKD